MFLDLFSKAMFDTKLIRHRRLAEWYPPDDIAKYLRSWIRKSLDKEAWNRLRAECRCPTIQEKVMNTPEFDTFISTYMIKQGRDPRKGIEKGLKAVQDNILDISGPLTQILANAHVALLAERWRAALYRIDARLADMAEKELGLAAAGTLFGELFIAELCKHPASYATLKKVENTFRRVFQPPSVF